MYTSCLQSYVYGWSYCSCIFFCFIFRSLHVFWIDSHFTISHEKWGENNEVFKTHCQIQSWKPACLPCPQEALTFRNNKKKKNQTHSEALFNPITLWTSCKLGDDPSASLKQIPQGHGAASNRGMRFPGLCSAPAPSGTPEFDLSVTAGASQTFKHSKPSPS